MQNTTSQSSGSLSVKPYVDQVAHIASDAKAQLLEMIPEKMNINDVERSVSGVVGGALAAVAVTRFIKADFLLGGLALAGGAALLARGLSGKCPISKAMGLDTRSEGEESTSQKSSTSQNPQGTQASSKTSSETLKPHTPGYAQR